MLTFIWLAVKFSSRIRNMSLLSHFLAGFVLEIGLLQEAIRAIVHLNRNRTLRVISTSTAIAYSIILHCFGEEVRFPFNNTATVNTDHFQRNGRLFILEGC